MILRTAYVGMHENQTTAIFITNSQPRYGSSTVWLLLLIPHSLLATLQSQLLLPLPGYIWCKTAPKSVHVPQQPWCSHTLFECSASGAAAASTARDLTETTISRSSTATLFLPMPATVTLPSVRTRSVAAFLNLHVLVLLFSATAAAFDAILAKVWELSLGFGSSKKF